MPTEDDLPEGLNELAYRNGIQIRPDPDFHNDMTRLINSLEKHLRKAPKREYKTLCVLIKWCVNILSGVKADTDHPPISSLVKEESHE